MNIYKHHSSVACIGEGFGFLAEHLLMITKVMSPYFLITSIFAVLTTALAINITVSAQTEGAIETSEIVATYLLYLLAAVAFVVSIGRLFLVFRRMNGAELSTNQTATNSCPAWKTTAKRTLWLSWHSLPYLIWFVVIGIPGLSPIIYIQEFLGTLSLEYKVVALFFISLLVLALMVFLSPLVYTFYCRMMCPTVFDDTEEGKIAKEKYSFKPAYKTAFSHKGKILGVVLLSFFLVLIASMVLFLPCLISSEAYLSSIEGKYNFNDTILIPTSAYVFMLIVAVVALALVQLFAVTMHTSLLYLFGDIHSSAEAPQTKQPTEK